MMISERLCPMNIIVAMDRCNGIGKNGVLPWRLPREMARFTRLTSATKVFGKRNAVLMGRKVWESIPAKSRPISNRLNVVLSHKMEKIAKENMIVVQSFESALDILLGMDDIETIWNIGGHEVYKLGLKSSLFHQLYLTRVDGDFKADTFFPEIDYDRLVKDESNEDEGHVFEEGGVTYQYEIFNNKLSKFI